MRYLPNIILMCHWLVSKIIFSSRKLRITKCYVLFAFAFAFVMVIWLARGNIGKFRNTNVDIRQKNLSTTFPIGQQQYTMFMGRKICKPGYGPDNICKDRMYPANPWYTADCPNLLKENTLDVDSKSSKIGGRNGCPKLYSWELCAALCYSHPKYGIFVVPKAIWAKALISEKRYWNGSKDNDDRSGEHLRGFNNYIALPLDLGNLIEVGAGPWTQTRAILKQNPNTIVKSFTVHEPSVKYYMKNVPTCAYKTLRLQKLDPRQGFHKFPVILQAEGGESLSIKNKSTNLYDTLVSINVIEHTQNGLAYLTGIHRALKPGGILVFHDRHFATPADADCLLGKDNMHPIRVTKFIFDVFFNKHFESLYYYEGPTVDTIRRKCNEKGIYAIFRKI